MRSIWLLILVTHIIWSCFLDKHEIWPQVDFNQFCLLSIGMTSGLAKKQVVINKQVVVQTE